MILLPQSALFLILKDELNDTFKNISIFANHFKNKKKTVLIVKMN